MSMRSILFLLHLAWLLIVTSCQRLESPDGECDKGFVCKSSVYCAQYVEKKKQLDTLSDTDPEYESILKELKTMVCNKADRGVCCRENFEIVNGNIVMNIEEMPFIARLQLKTSYGSSSICGAALIASQFLLSAKHCFDFDFYNLCISERDCVAYFRDLRHTGIGSHDRGEFYIPIFDIFKKSGHSDLVVVKLKHPVEEHKDYGLGVPLRPIQLAQETPRAGEVETFCWITENCTKIANAVQ